MKQAIVIKDSAAAQLVRRGQGPSDQLDLRGVYEVEHWRNGQLIGTYRLHNAITIEGKNKLLDVMFHGVAAIGTWYIGLVDNAGFSAAVEADTYAQIGGTNGWTEFTNYSNNRKEWTEGAASAKAITNGTPVTFDVTGAGSAYGLFLAGGANAETKGDATAGNTLWSVAAFSGGAVTVGNGDQLKVTYTVQS